jgi:hypothetical protein
MSHAVHIYRDVMMEWVHRARRKSLAVYLRDLQEFVRGVFTFAKDIITRALARFRIYLLRIWSALRRTSQLPTQCDTEPMSFEELYLHVLHHPADPTGGHSIQWVLETSTDMDIIATAVQMVPEVEWRNGHDVIFMLDQLTSQLYAYCASPWQLTPHLRERVRNCLKAIFHLYTEQGLWGPLAIRNHNIFNNDHHSHAMPNEQDFYLISCVVEKLYDLDIASLSFADRMWMARILTFRLHDGVQHPVIRRFVLDFINKCLQDPKTPPRLVADCLLLAGLMVGVQPGRRYIRRIDKR